MSLRIFLATLVFSLYFEGAYTQPEAVKDSAVLHERITLLKQAALRLPKKDQKKFEDVYLDFLKEYKRSFRCSYLTLTNLAKATTFIHNTDAFDCLNSMISMRTREIRLRERYFQCISKELGGRAAYEFIRIEASVSAPNSPFVVMPAGNEYIADPHSAVTARFEHEQRRLLGALCSNYAKTLFERNIERPLPSRKQLLNLLRIERDYAQLQEKYLHDMKSLIDFLEPVACGP